MHAAARGKGDEEISFPSNARCYFLLAHAFLTKLKKTPNYFFGTTSASLPSLRKTGDTEKNISLIFLTMSKIRKIYI